MASQSTSSGSRAAEAAPEAAPGAGKRRRTSKHTSEMSGEGRARRQVGICEMFRFANFTDKVLILLGSAFAFLEGAGAPAMALVFGGMTNTLVTTVQFGFSDAPLASATAAPPAEATPAAPPQAPLQPLPSAAEFEALMSTFAIYYVIIGVAVYLSSMIQITCWQTACERQVHRMRRAFFRSVLRQEIAWFDRNRAGELSAKFNDDVERVRDALGEQFSSIIKYTSSFLSGYIVGFVVSWRLTLVILAVSPLLALFSGYLGRMMATSSRREQEKYAKAGALAEEVLVSVRTVFALNGQTYEIKNYSRLLNEGLKMALVKYVRLAFVVGLSLFVLYATYGLALYVSTQLLLADKITAGAAMSVIMAVMMGASALGNIIPPLQTIMVGTSSASLIYEIVDSLPHIDPFNERGLKLSKVTANIKFENVTFAYPTRPAVEVIKELNFELNQSQTVAICGRTGSGKSTIVNLLLRFYDPQAGVIYLDNCNLCDLNVAWLRSLAGLVEQEPALFDCSIFENIALGAQQDSDRSYERVIEAAKLANAHEFIINLPDGYNTRCGDRGVQMSGGQKQRIAIARALISDPKILLLDEATSALDSESEFMVQQALNRARQGRTTVVIAHRLSTIRDADLICVMDEGRLVEMGRHDELMARQAHYHQLVTNQVFNDDSNGSGTGSEPAPPLSPAVELGGEGAGALSAGLASDLDSDSAALGASARQRRASAYSSGAGTPVGGRFTSTPARLRAKTPPADGAAAAAAAAAEHRLSTTLYESVNRPLKGIVERETGAGSDSDKESGVPLPSVWDTMRLCRPEAAWIGSAVVATILQGALMPAFALFYAQIFATFTLQGDELSAAGGFWALAFLGLALANFVIMWLRIYLGATAVELAMARIRAQCFANLLRQHVGWFDMGAHAPQRLSTRLAADVPQIKAVLNARITSIISGLATVAFALIIAFYLGWQLALLLTAALPILLYVGYFQMRQSRGDRAQHARRMENASRLATEAIEHVKLIQAMNQERHFYDKFVCELREPRREALRNSRRFGLVYGLSQSTIYFVYGAAFRFGAYLIASGQLDAITVFRIFFAIAFTAVAVGQWGGIGGDLSRANYSIGLIMRLLRAQPDIDNLSRGGIKPQLRGSISLTDVHFRYPTRPHTPVLQGLTLNVRPGQTLALVGPSGQGKSTIAALLLRFYDPDRGSVRLDTHDLRCINLAHLRLNVGLVQQEPCLFRGTIKDNILYGLDRARFSMRDVVQAAKTANAHQFIKALPDGYETMIGERGAQLSGGQKQRVAIARTLVRRPTVLILDEATSALDADSERLVSSALEQASKGKTCIKIAHRLSTVRDADQIAVIERGVVVESGTHEQLMARGKHGHYFRLMQKQEISH